MLDKTLIYYMYAEASLACMHSCYWRTFTTFIKTAEQGVEPCPDGKCWAIKHDPILLDKTFSSLNTLFDHVRLCLIKLQSIKYYMYPEASLACMHSCYWRTFTTFIKTAEQGVKPCPDGKCRAIKLDPI